MRAKPATPEAFRLVHNGALALSRVAHAGMRVDVAYLDQAIIDLDKKINALTEEMWATEYGKVWQQTYTRPNIDSRDELEVVLYEKMGHKRPSVTLLEREDEEDREDASDRDEIALERLELPFADNYIKLQKFKKIHGTYLKGVRGEVEGEFGHPFGKLHTTVTYRSSYSDYSLQNMPIRKPEFSHWIRRCFIPRQHHRLLEVDLVGAEVKCAACYHKDPTMLRYIRDGYDMHRDMAAECYRLPRDMVPKQARQQAKALFVFAEFYGDYWLSCAQSLWDAVRRYKLMDVAGHEEWQRLENLAKAKNVPEQILKDRLDQVYKEHSLYAHMAGLGITELGDSNPRAKAPRSGTFEAHIKDVENGFWNERFKVYSNWKKAWYDQYLQAGGFQTLTGFTINGVLSRNACINYPVQGSAFQWLLWCLIQLDKWLRENKMRTVIIGQIHDSIIIDVHEDEFEDVVAAAYHIFHVLLPDHFPWIITPIEVEMEACDQGESWYDKKPVCHCCAKYLPKKGACPCQN